MSDHIFDLDDGEFLYQMDDDYALGSDGHIVQNAGGGLGMDLNTGEFHMTSGWDSGDDQPMDEDDGEFLDMIGDDLSSGQINNSPNGAAHAPDVEKSTTPQESSDSKESGSSSKTAEGQKYGRVPDHVDSVSQDEGKDRKHKKTGFWLVVISIAVIALAAVLLTNYETIQARFEEWQINQLRIQHEQNLEDFLARAARYDEDMEEEIRDDLSDRDRNKELAGFTESFSVDIQSAIEVQNGKETWVETVTLDVEADENYEEEDDRGKAIDLGLYAMYALRHLHLDNSLFLPGDLRRAMEINGLERIVKCHVTITTEQNVYEYEYHEKYNYDSYYLNGEFHKVVVEPTTRPRATARPVSTPKPTPTPRRTTPKPTTNSDPFNAGDYVHPDDFYYDYYDDFWDYEDAEDYWEEWD